MGKTYKKNGGKVRVKQNGDEISAKELKAIEAKQNARSRGDEDDDAYDWKSRKGDRNDRCDRGW
jgi:hypothetical protein